MKILVTGATGMVGSALTGELLAADHQVVAWSRSAERVRELLGEEVIPLSGETTAAQLAAALSSVEGVVNLAGENLFAGRWTATRKAALVSSRVDLTRRLATAIRAAVPPPRVLVSGSAVGYYGDRGSLPTDESSPPGAGFLAELCQRWEAAALEAVPPAAAPDERGPRVVLLRIGIVLGRGGGALARLLPLFRRGLGGTLGRGDQQVSWIHLEDLCRVIIAALADPRYRGPINATAPGPVTNRELTRELARVLRHRALLPVPGVALRLALGEAAGALLEGQRVLPRQLEALGFLFRFPALGAALTDLLDGASAAGGAAGS